MWIRSQDKKILGEFISVNISEDLFGKKCYISGMQLTGGFSGHKEVILGTYDSLTKALEELDKLQEYMNKHLNSVYQIQ